MPPGLMPSARRESATSCTPAQAAGRHSDWPRPGVALTRIRPIPPARPGTTRRDERSQWHCPHRITPDHGTDPNNRIPERPALGPSPQASSIGRAINPLKDASGAGDAGRASARSLTWPPARTDQAAIRKGGHEASSLHPASGTRTRISRPKPRLTPARPFRDEALQDQPRGRAYGPSLRDAFGTLAAES